MWRGIKDTKLERKLSSASWARLSNASLFKDVFLFHQLFPISFSCLPENMFTFVKLNHFICSLDAC